MPKIGVKVLRLLIVLFIGICFTYPGWTSQATFGAEFTFTNPNVLKAAENVGSDPIFESTTHVTVDYQNRLIDQIISICPNCNAKPRKADFTLENSIVTITWPDDFWISIHRDPGVIEINMKPLTVPEIARNLHRIQTFIFDAAKAVELSPHPVIGGGHIHIGLQSAFGGNSLLLRNFIVDFFNHEGFSRTLGYDYMNAQMLLDLPLDLRLKFAEIVEEWGNALKASKKSAGGKHSNNYRNFLELIHHKVYNWHPSDWIFPFKFKAINLNHILFYTEDSKFQTLEIRTFLPQKTAYQFYLLTYILEGRLMKLRDIKTPIPLRNIEKPYDPVQGVQEFVRYVSESGVDVNEMKRFFTLEYNHHKLLRYQSSPQVIMMCDRVYRPTVIDPRF